MQSFVWLQNKLQQLVLVISPFVTVRLTTLHI